MGTQHQPPTVYPNVPYQDCSAAIDWLTSVLGFAVHSRYDDDEGRVTHCELRFGNGMVMTHSLHADGTDWLGGRPGRSGVTLVADHVAQVDGAHRRVVDAGAKIVQPLRDQVYDDSDPERFSNHSFTCVDPEGNWWSIGTYQPAADG